MFIGLDSPFQYLVLGCTVIQFHSQVFLLFSILFQRIFAAQGNKIVVDDGIQNAGFFTVYSLLCVRHLGLHANQFWMLAAEGAVHLLVFGHQLHILFTQLLDQLIVDNLRECPRLVFDGLSIKSFLGDAFGLCRG